MASKAHSYRSAAVEFASSQTKQQSEYYFGRSGVIPTLVFFRKKKCNSNSYSTGGNCSSNKMTVQNRQNLDTTNITDTIVNFLLNKTDELVVAEALPVVSQAHKLSSDVPSPSSLKDESISTSSSDPMNPANKIPSSSDEEALLKAKRKRKRDFTKKLLNDIKIKVDEYEKANGEINLPPHYCISSNKKDECTTSDAFYTRTNLEPTPGELPNTTNTTDITVNCLLNKTDESVAEGALSVVSEAHKFRQMSLLLRH